MLATIGLVAALLATTVSAAPVSAAAGDITTVAGGGNPPAGNGDGLAAVAARLAQPWGVEEQGGELFISELGPPAPGGAAGPPRGRVRKVNAGGVISTLAGGGTPKVGDNRPGSLSLLRLPEGVQVVAGGHLYIADERQHRVRRVDAGADGVVDGDPDEKIVTVAGTGTAGTTGDGGPATAARVDQPLRVAADSAGNIFIGALQGCRVRKVTPGADGVVDGDADEIISTVVGDGSCASGAGDGGPAASAGLSPRGVAVGADNDLYVADVSAQRVRRVDAGGNGVVDGSDIITTYAGGGALPMGAEGEGALATDASINFPEGIDFDTAGNLFISSVGESRAMRVDTTQHIITVAGTGESAFNATGPVGDGGPAKDALLGFVFGLTVDAAGNLYLADVTLDNVRRVVPGADGVVDGDADEIINVFAGASTLPGDGGPALDADLRRPADVDAGPGGLYIAEANDNRVRRVDGAGIITTVAGGGIGDGLNGAVFGTLDDPRGVATDGAGNVFVADCRHQRVRKIDAAGIITTHAGGLLPFRCPSGLHMVTAGPSAGTLYVADAGSHQLLRVDPGGAVTPVAGTGVAGFSGDGGPAAAAQLNGPSGVFRDGAGNVFIADSLNHRVRRIDAVTGTISTVAGDGTFNFGQNGVGAKRTSVADPTDVAIDANGNLLIAEQGFQRLRLVVPGPDGVVNGGQGEQISTIAGNGVPGFGGDGGPAPSAVLNRPTQLDLDAVGDLFFTDLGNNRVRRIEGGTIAPPPPNGCGQVITQDTVLTADIGPCAGDGVIIGAGGITLDLNGHTISGTDGSTGNVGVKIEARRNVTVRGRGATAPRNAPFGTIRGFDGGVAVIGGQGNDIRLLNVTDNIGFENYGDGIVLFFTARNRVSNNRIVGNGVYDGIGILGIGSHDNVIRSNLVAETQSLGEPPPVGIGIALNPFVSEVLPREQSIFGNRIENNTVRDNDNSGISNISNVNGVITGNLVENNGRAPFASPANGIGINALELAGANTNVLVQNNHVLGNGSTFPDGTPFQGDGVNIASNENHVLTNEVHANKGNGILVRGSNFTGKRNEIRENNAADNGLPGFFRGDLVDTNQDFVFDPFFAQIFHCDENVWFGNIWGSGGFWPDAAFHDPDGGIVIESSCTATGGHPEAAVATRASAAPAEQPPPVPDYKDLDRGHPPIPR